eukprot:CAMPEP_0170492536 /NCGR_PEP_ID=MMETSP0208-20121228/12399_1 /TAXON_ID=197538 /ORGANISM="Strombidium inclinatum, Strain S3" /LENGTH=195 /DNA_ID=CAMNT_0010768291 /DNA_START=6 /DNA_END=593 /DNA_ORIENTATION=+
MSIQKQVPEFKVILIGDAGVGKTSITIRATQNTFDLDGTSATVGFSFQKLFKEVPNLGCANLFIWDTAGQEQFRSMTKMYYRGVAVALIVYDVTERASFEQVEDWLENVREVQQQRLTKEGDQDSASTLVVGNKSDLDDEREVTYEEGAAFIEEYKENQEDEPNIKFVEVSAKEGTNISAMFESISVELLEAHNE